MHYERHGEGSRVLVFVHGLLLDNKLNRRLAADLADHGFQVVLVDLPGHGRSDKPATRRPTGWMPTPSTWWPCSTSSASTTPSSGACRSGPT